MLLCEKDRPSVGKRERMTPGQSQFQAQDEERDADSANGTGEDGLRKVGDLSQCGGLPPELVRRLFRKYDDNSGVNSPAARFPVPLEPEK